MKVQTKNMTISTDAKCFHFMYNEKSNHPINCRSFNLKACSNETNVFVQHHPPLLNAACWVMLADDGRCWIGFDMFKILIQHCATFDNYTHDH
jgi:hypothetical protein